MFFQSSHMKDLECEGSLSKTREEWRADLRSKVDQRVSVIRSNSLWPNITVDALLSTRAFVAVAKIIEIDSKFYSAKKLR